MKVLIVYARLYASCLGKAAQGLGKNTWTILLPMGLFFALLVLSAIAANIPLIGPFLVPLVAAAIGSAYLYFVGEIVGRSRVRLNELSRAIRVYFWSLVNLMFVLWIAAWLLMIVLRSNPNASVILTIFELAMLILLNPAPEIIYQEGTYGGTATVQRSIHFIQENWIEWFIPMIAIGAAYHFGWTRGLQELLFRAVGAGTIGAARVAGGGPGPTLVAVTAGSLVAWLISSILLGALLHYLMLFRGFLFQELKGSSHRQRMFKYRNAISGR